MTQNRESHDREAEIEAQARLDQLRHQAGGALSGGEILRRLGRSAEEADETAPPLDWRLTPRNIILQLGALALFVAVVGFMGWLVYSGVSNIAATLSQ